MPVSLPHRYRQAKAMTVSDNRPTWSTGPGGGARGRRRGLAGQRADAPSQPSAHQAPLVWRAPEGPEGLATVPVGGGRAWPGFETTRRAKLAARTARGRAAAHGHTKQPGPTAGSDGAQNTSGATNDKTARPHRGRAAQQVSEAHRRITTMSGSPRPLSWRTLEIPSLAAISFAVPSIRGSS